MEILRNPGETGIPAGFADQLQDAYTEDISIRDAAVQERETVISGFDTERASFLEKERQLKAANYDLLMSAPKPGNEPGENDNQDDDGPRGIASLLEKETR